MLSTPLRNYIRTHRKAAGLSQDDLAFLLGCKSGSKVSRYERFTRQPTAPTIFACVVILHVSAEVLFAGQYAAAAKLVAQRAERLLQRLSARPDTPLHRRKVAAIERIVGRTPGAVPHRNDHDAA